MTIEKHIDALLGLINRHGEGEAPFSREFVYHHFTVSAATLMRRKYDRSKSISDFNMAYYCVGMEMGTVHDCNCVDVGCDVMRSKVAIPRPVMGKDRPFIRVMTLDHRDIPHVHASVANAVNLDRTRKGKLHYSIVNNHIILWNSKPGIPKAILVSGLFEDPSEWAGIELCDEQGDGTGESCYNIAIDDYPVDQDLVDGAYALVLNRLRIPLSIPEDRINEND